VIFYRSALAGLFLALSMVTSVKADLEECQAAIRKYNNALNDVSDALRRYANCVRDSRAHDDCSLEFGRVRSAQDDFESAVSAYGSDCQREL
jgi:hypothetical protein